MKDSVFGRGSVLCAVVMVLLGYDSSSACSCRPLEACEALRYCNVVFVGRVVEGEILQEQYQYQDKTYTSPLGKYRLKVDEAFVGVTETEVTVHVLDINKPCGGPLLSVGERYLVYAVSVAGPRKVITGSCSPTKRLSSAEADLAFLKQLPEPGAGGRIFGEVIVEKGGRTPAPLEAVSIVVADERNISFQTRTDRNGRYEFIGLKPGRYTVTAVVPAGYRPERPSGLEDIVYVVDRACAKAAFRVHKPKSR